jgi:hypothetical protein
LSRYWGVALCSICLGLPGPAFAQESIHWAYASYFGTGTYSLDNGVRTVLLGLSPKWEWRSASISESGRRTAGIERIGYSDSNSVSDAINLLTTGLDFSRPLRRKKLGGAPVVIHWHAMFDR